MVGSFFGTRGRLWDRMSGSTGYFFALAQRKNVASALCESSTVRGCKRRPFRPVLVASSAR
jgi:hypothetical protein